MRTFKLLASLYSFCEDIIALYDRIEIKLCIPPLLRTELKFYSSKKTGRDIYSTKHDPSNFAMTGILKEDVTWCELVRHGRNETWTEFMLHFKKKMVITAVIVRIVAFWVI